jgi:hypothetical protein
VMSALTAPELSASTPLLYYSNPPFRYPQR